MSERDTPNDDPHGHQPMPFSTPAMRCGPFPEGCVCYRCNRVGRCAAMTKTTTDERMLCARCQRKDR